MIPRNLPASTMVPFAALCLAPLACFAQAAPSTITEFITQVPKPGMTAKLEDGIKAVEAYAKSQAAPTTFTTFEVMDGPQRGSIVVLTPFSWAAMDNPPSYAAGIQREVDKSVNPYLSSLLVSTAEVVPTLGIVPAANTPPAKYYQVINLDIKPGCMNDFISAVTQVTAAEHKQNPSSNAVLIYREVSGGDANRVTVAIAHPTAADFGAAGKSIDQVLRETYGEEAAASVSRLLDGSIAHEENFVVRYRPELSYTPSGG
jgi:hypothetical protein